MGKWPAIERMPVGSVRQAVVEFIGSSDDPAMTITGDGRKRDIDEMSVHDRELRFRVSDRQFVTIVDGGVMTGTFTFPDGRSGRLVGLVAR